MNGRKILFILITILIASTAFGQMTVLSSAPINGAVGVGLSSTVSFTFSEALDTSRRIGDEGLCVYLLSHDPSDSLQPRSIYFSSDLHMMFFDVTHTANTDFTWLLAAAFAQNGDSLAMPFGLCYTTAASHGDYAVSGTVTVEGGGSPAAAVMGLMNTNPFGDHGALLGGTVITNANGSYSAALIRPGVYYPICARDGNHDGNMDSDADMIGIYDPNHTGQPQTITVTNANVSNVNMVLAHLNHWTTAREYVDTARTVAAGYGNDWQLMMIQSNNDTIGTDGKSRGWTYCFSSPTHQRLLNLYIDAMHIAADTSQNNQFPPNMLTLPLDFMDSDAIMAIAESHGGAQIRTQHDIQEVRLNGGNMQWNYPQNPSAIYWDAQYSWQNGNSEWESWDVFMDIHTGEILSTDAVEPLPCASAAHEFRLLANFPNPFNPSTTVPFVLANAGHVDLKVFDVQGREVATLVNGTLPAGAHSVLFNANRLPNGVYFCRLETGQKVLTQKMLLIK